MSTATNRDYEAELAQMNHIAPDGTLRINARKPFLLRIEIDNQDGALFPKNPFTLNAYLLPQSDAPLEPLILGGGGGALIEGDVPALLRELAALIEDGEVGL